MSTLRRVLKAKAMLPDTAAIKGELNLRDLATAGKPPNKFLSLDIETSGGTLSILETMELVVAGVVVGQLQRAAAAAGGDVDRATIGHDLPASECDCVGGVGAACARDVDAGTGACGRDGHSGSVENSPGT